MKYVTFLLCSIFCILIAAESPASSQSNQWKCTPTEPDMLGPFYKPNAPVRSSVGKGYVLSGTVKSAADCRTIPNAKIEFWLAGPNGEYDDAHRATMRSDKEGRYRFESNIPVPYGGRPPHIHLKVSADGYKTLVTQHYPARSQTESTFDIVLIPAR